MEFQIRHDLYAERNCFVSTKTMFSRCFPEITRNLLSFTVHATEKFARKNTAKV